jgi:Transcriptional regulator containing an amidase domain and an AraC-type DNA-binding HTH domain
MSHLDGILRAKQSLKMNLENWERFRKMPGRVQDLMIAADYFQQPDLPFDIAEIVIDEPVAWEKTDQYYISLLLNGEQARPMELELEQGEGRFLRPNQPGSMIFSDGMRDKTFLGRGPYQIISLAINRPYLHSRIQELYGGTPDDLSSLLTSPHFDSVCAQNIKRLMAICRTPGNLIVKDDLLDAIIGRLWTKTGRSAKRSQRTTARTMSATSMESVIDYMKDNLSKDLGRDELARIAQVSPGHFSRLFSSTVGHSPKHYLLLLRLERAQMLLKQNRQLPVSEISRLCGFSDQANFYHAFRDHTGCSPAKFRETV